MQCYKLVMDTHIQLSAIHVFVFVSCFAHLMELDYLLIHHKSFKLEKKKLLQ